MADLGLFDIVALAKAGYKKKDIDMIIAGDDNNQSKPADNNVPDNKVPDNGPEPPKEPANDPIPEGNDDKTPEPDDKDYKKLYEELQKSSADMQSQIKELQSKINSKDNSGSAGKDTTMDDLMSSFKNFS